jgi:multidrug efflux system membrane fusion protein
VRAVAAVRGSIAVRLEALGTVTAYNTVTVRSRVDGELVRVLFDEGQQVRTGQALAEIDPRPFEVALAQAQGELQRDQALLANAEVDLARYRDLLAQDSIAKQQVDGQEALVRQYRGTVLTDEAQVKNAELQLTYAHITAPIDGRVGLRQVDPGNLIRAGDAGGIVTIAQIRPIAVLFSLPQDTLPDVVAGLAAGALPVFALASKDGTELARGALLTVDNNIDQTTGTYRLKAVFPNQDSHLWPGQFVHVRLQVRNMPQALTVPAQAVQRGPDGLFAYVVTKDSTAAVAPITVVQDDARVAVIGKGLEPGQVVVVSGQSKLRTGARVAINDEKGNDEKTGTAAPAPRAGG